MTLRYLFILLIILAIAFSLTYLLRVVRKFLIFLSNSAGHSKGKAKDKSQEVLYKKDDIVVLKGEADKNKNEK